MNRSVLVTGATSGLGLEAAAQFLQIGADPVILTGRTEARALAATEAVRARTGLNHTIGLELDLEQSTNIEAAAARLADEGVRLDVLVLNAGMMAGRTRRRTPEGVDETFAASLTGHHVFTMALLRHGVLSDSARIVISGSEAARGDVPMMRVTNLHDLASRRFDGDLVTAARALIAGDEPSTFRANSTYADAKMFVAWWAAALARRLPTGMSVNAVSPGATPRTEAGRHKGVVMRRLMVPVMKAMPERLNMGGSVESGAHRYVAAADFDADISGNFFASAPKRMSGQLVRVTLDHLVDIDSQEAAWKALAEITRSKPQLDRSRKGTS